jgi:hypothetical protein
MRLVIVKMGMKEEGSERERRIICHSSETHVKSRMSEEVFKRRGGVDFLSKHMMATYDDEGEDFHIIHHLSRQSVYTTTNCTQGNSHIAAKLLKF